MSLTIYTEPTREPLLLEETKLHCRVDTDDDDTLILGLITAAREQAEATTRRALITQTWDLVMDAFPGEDRIELPLPPLQSVTSITYVDSDGNTNTFSSSKYIVDTDSEPGRVVLVTGESWPSDTLRAAAGVTVRFVCGYGDAASDVPRSIRQGMLLAVGHWYENREATVGVGNMQVLPMGVEALWWPYRVFSF